MRTAQTWHVPGPGPVSWHCGHRALAPKQVYEFLNPGASILVDFIEIITVTSC